MSGTAARILVIEDHPDNMTLMTYLLETSGHTTVRATSAAEGLRLASEVRPDLVLLDIQLPDMDGTSVAEALRGSRTGRDLPIVAVTALAMLGEQERIMASGIDGYLTKPITPETFVRDVEQYLRPASKRPRVLR